MRILSKPALAALGILAACGDGLLDESARQSDSLERIGPEIGAPVVVDSLELDLALVGPELLIYGTVIKIDADPAGNGRDDIKGYQTPVSLITLEASEGDGAVSVAARCLSNCPDEGPLFEVTAREGASALVLERDAILSAFGVGGPLRSYGGGERVLDHEVSVFPDNARGWVFDISTLIEVPWDTNFWMTTRWLVAPAASLLDPTLEPLDPIPEIGVLRPGVYDYELSRPGIRHTRETPIHFLIKAVPERHHQAVDDAFSAWNALSTEELGYPILSYEHLDPARPDYEYFIAGDPRYNIIEWDRINDAYYAGIALNAAVLETGQVLRSGIWLQGPSVEALNRDWFGIDEPLNSNQATRKSALTVARVEAKAEPARDKIPVGRFRFYPPEEERVTEFFEVRDPTLDYESYMYGYMKNLVIHELGHALGLGHNFKGSIVEDEDRISNSVMEYVHRNVRHRRSLGRYDGAALAYIYAERLPTSLEPFCDSPPWVGEPTLNAECSTSDGGVDPLSFFQAGLELAVDRTLGLGQAGGVPIWPGYRIGSHFRTASQGMLFYAASAEASSHEWLKFHRVSGRPSEPAAIAEYVVELVYDTVCQDLYAQHAESLYQEEPAIASAAVTDWSLLVSRLDDDVVRMNLELQPCYALWNVEWMMYEN